LQAAGPRLDDVDGAREGGARRCGLSRGQGRLAGQALEAGVEGAKDRLEQALISRSVDDARRRPRRREDAVLILERESGKAQGVLVGCFPVARQ
jgi:hypothetical protein